MTLLRSLVRHLLDPRPAWAREEQRRMERVIAQREEVAERMQRLLRTKESGTGE